MKARWRDRFCPPDVIQLLNNWDYELDCAAGVLDDFDCDDWDLYDYVDGCW